jgi:hypothetical protein
VSSKVGGHWRGCRGPISTWCGDAMPRGWKATRSLVFTLELGKNLTSSHREGQGTADGQEAALPPLLPPVHRPREPLGLLPVVPARQHLVEGVAELLDARAARRGDLARLGSLRRWGG